MIGRAFLAVLAALALVLSAAVTVQGCTGEPGVNGWICPDDSKEPGYYDQICIEDRALRDAGTKDAGDASADGAPGSGPLSESCHGRCLPLQPQPKEGPEDGPAWSELPGLVWLGPAAELPAACPGEAPTERARLFADLVSPPLSCPPCDCEAPEGSCPGLPSITANAGQCGEAGAASSSFDGPAGWDGSCTNANALPAGAQCPPGSGTPCVQSVTLTALPAPIEEPCKPTIQPPAPAPPMKQWTWQTAALACVGVADYTCGDAGIACVAWLAPPWRHCVWAANAAQLACPAAFSAERFVMHGKDAVIDDRECSSCECGPPVGGACSALVPMYEDATCTKPIMGDALVTSSFGQCINVPAGTALGSKAITDVGYTPGTCAPTGGEAKGEAHPDDTGAVTFCCKEMFDP